MIDLKIVEFFNHLQLGVFGRILEFICREWVLTVLTIIALGLITIIDRKNGRKIVLTAIIALAINFFVVNFLIKYFLPFFGVERIRPYLAYPDSIIPYGIKVTDSSFPSGHLSSMSSFLIVLAYYYRKFWPYAILILIVIGFERMFAGMHYLTDVIAGAIFGLAFACLAIYLVNKWYNKNK